MNTIYILLISFLLIFGCSAPEIDTSSDKKMEKSIETVRNSLSEGKRNEFDKAIKTIAFNQVEFKDILSQGIAGEGSATEKIKIILDGKTGDEVIAAADSIIQKRKEKERKQALQEIKELEKRKAEAKSDLIKIKKFKVLRSRYYMQEREFGSDQPIIELTVKNGTQHPISRAYFIGTVASPDRTIPWIKESFNYKINGGLEPGEKATWELAPNMFSEWGTVDVPNDAILTVKVKTLDGVVGETLFSSEKFDEDDRERLKKLKSEYGIE